LPDWFCIASWHDRKRLGCPINLAPEVPGDCLTPGRASDKSFCFFFQKEELSVLF
jgi:hypothetical protein